MLMLDRFVVETKDEIITDADEKRRVTLTTIIVDDNFDDVTKNTQFTTTRIIRRFHALSITTTTAFILFTTILLFFTPAPGECMHVATPTPRTTTETAVFEANKESLICDQEEDETKTTISAYKTVSPEDDEIHDDEIMEAVRNSLRLWQQSKLNKTHHNNSSHSRVKRDEEVVCYGSELGCFRDEGPFNYLDMLPSPPEEIDTKFMFYSKDSEPETFSFFNYTTLSLGSGGGGPFNASRPTKVIIHGFGSTCLRMWANEMRSALLSVVECNVICVDWENGAQLPNYVRAAVNTRLVGKQLSLLIRKLVGESTASYESFHLIGFSLGAHVAGFSGQELKNISRITGLDPAGPLFENYDKRVRLDSTDAMFVDVIHSNGDSLLMGGLGSWEPIGHLDFYPNGGRVQKGCSNLFLGAFRDFIWSSPSSNKDKGESNSPSESRNGKSMSTGGGSDDGRSLCNHRRAYRFFTESVSPRCPYPAFSCESYDKFLTGACFQWDNSLVHSAHMGYYADEHVNNPRMARQLSTTNPPPTTAQSSKNGAKNFYLMTRDDEPFCANQYKLTLESSPPLGIPISTYGGVEAILINANDDFNETFLLTQTAKDNMISGSVLQKLVVAHPAMNEPAKMVLKYTAYKGWIYSGISRWSLDRLIITNAFGVSYSFCARGLLLPSGISVTVSLQKGICAIANFPFRYPFFHHHMRPHHAGHPLNSLHSPHQSRNDINETHLPPISTLSPNPEGELSINSVSTTPSSFSNNSSSASTLIDWSNDWQPIIVRDSLAKNNQSVDAPTMAVSNEEAKINANNNQEKANASVNDDGILAAEDHSVSKDKVETKSSITENDEDLEVVGMSNRFQPGDTRSNGASDHFEMEDNLQKQNKPHLLKPDHSNIPENADRFENVQERNKNYEGVNLKDPGNEHFNQDNEIDPSERRSSRQLTPLMMIPLSRAIEPRPVMIRTSRQQKFPQNFETETNRGRMIRRHHIHPMNMNLHLNLGALKHSHFKPQHLIYT